MPSRRRFVALAAVAGATTVTAGCAARAPTSGGTSDEGAVPSLDDGDRVRGRASAVSLDRALSLREHQSYVEENDTVRYPKSTSGGGEFSYGYVDLARWLRLEATFVGKQAVRERLDDSLPSLEWVSVVATGQKSSGLELEVVHSTFVDDGTVVDEPDASAAKFAAETPSTVDLTVRLRGETYSATYPVYVRKRVDRHIEDRTERGTSNGGTETATRERGTTDGPVRGGASRASVDREVTDDDFAYVEENDTVRYPAARAGETVVEYGYEPFDDWGDVEGASTAAGHVRSLLTDRLPSADSLSVAVSYRDDGLRLSVFLTTHLARDGDVISEPSVSRPEVVAATPHSVTATVRFAGRTHTETYPVYVQERTKQNA